MREGQDLKRARQKTHLTQIAAAGLLSISPGLLSKYERGIETMPEGFIEKARDTYDMAMVSSSSKETPELYTGGVIQIESVEIVKFRLFEATRFMLSPHVTVIAGHNGIGKTTILGILGNCGRLASRGKYWPLIKSDFSVEFSELFKASPEFDPTLQNIASINFNGLKNPETGHEPYPMGFRTGWQKQRNKQESRFRIIPSKRISEITGQRTESKLMWPTLYLGLSRLYPVGEIAQEEISTETIDNLQSDEWEWFFGTYRAILNLQHDIKSAMEIRAGGFKRSMGVSTNRYSHLSNSAGQDNLSQILLAALSFQRLARQMGSDWKGGLLLIDELDTALHPAAQKKLVDELLRMSKRHQFQVVFTTHSQNLLEYIAGRTRNNDYRIVYLTNANYVIEVMENPTRHTMRSDLNISTTNSASGMLVWSEDAEARWFLRNILPAELSDQLYFVEASFGFKHLLKLLEQDYQYFSSHLMVFDGDARQEVERFSNKHKDWTNWLLLPGDVRPEQVIFEYLDSILGGQPPLNSRTGFTRRYIFDDVWQRRNPSKKEREQYKEWFKELQGAFEENQVMECWKKDHPTELKNLINEVEIILGLKRS